MLFLRISLSVVMGCFALCGFSETFSDLNQKITELCSQYNIACVATACKTVSTSRLKLLRTFKQSLDLDLKDLEKIFHSLTNRTQELTSRIEDLKAQVSELESDRNLEKARELHKFLVASGKRP